jgi:hypothetical protein
MALIIYDVRWLLFFAAHYAVTNAKALDKNVLRKCYVIHGRTALSLICCIAHWVILG